MDDFAIENLENHKILLKLLELLRRSFFGPSGGKSDALNPFSMVPKASFDFAQIARIASALFFRTL